jgi:hypothetical protein
LELLTFYDEVKAGELSEESLKVKRSVLNKCVVLIAEGLFWRNARDWDAWEPLLQDIVQQEKFIVASLCLPCSLPVLSTHIISNMTTVVVRVLN